MSVDVHIGHCLDVLRVLPEESVQCVVTSPPYWGLRDYGLDPVVWGGSGNCSHAWGNPLLGPVQAQWREDVGNKGDVLSDADERHSRRKWTKPEHGQFCLHCNAWRGTLGLEPNPDLYVTHLVEVFQAVRRVLRGDGTCWLNLGDSFASQGGSGKQGSSGQRADRTFTLVRDSGTRPPEGLKPKDLVMIPARVALALQADGWYLRSDIIWHKPNPMPESVTDRPTKSYDHVFLLAKSGKYYYDAEAVKELQSQSTISRFGKTGRRTGSGPKTIDSPNGLVRDRSSGTWDKGVLENGRNLRDVWTIPTEAYPEAHFATFPAALVEPCIKAGCPGGGVVLDPFAGSGTVGEVARRFGCRAVLIEAQPKYASLIEKRLAQGVLF